MTDPTLRADIQAFLATQEGIESSRPVNLLRRAAEEIAAANARCERMRKALLPFANNADYAGALPDDCIVGMLGDSADNAITVGNLRAARDASGETGEGRG